MTIVVTLTLAGAQAGPFNIYHDASVPPYTSAVATNVTRQQLIQGYPVTVPDNTTMVKVLSIGICKTEVLMSTGITTSSTSSTSSTTTTTTTSPAIVFTVGADNVGLACGAVNTITLYSTTSVVSSNLRVFSDSALTAPYNGALKYYRNAGTVWRIDTDGYITTGTFCVT